MSTAPFSKTHLREVPFVHKWLNDNQQSCTTKGHGDVCCDPITRKCGIGVAPLTDNQQPANPYLMLAGFHPRLKNEMCQATSCSSFNSELFFNHGNGDVTGHISGQHTFTSVVDGTCNYTAPTGVTGPGPCNVTCNAWAFFPSVSIIHSQAGQMSSETYFVIAEQSIKDNLGIPVLKKRFMTCFS
jgi:hypothetical protein